MSTSDNESTSKSKRKSNISLPERTTTAILPNVARRNTITETINSSQKRKKVKIPSTPTIPEDGTITIQVPSLIVENESKKLNRKSSIASGTSSIGAYENKSFEGSLKRTSSTNNTKTDSRTPSEQGLDIYMEQYCCCAKRTKSIVIGVMAKHDQLRSLLNLET
ncbi:hypothetical protein ABEB36_000709 [Hypothenemus hampei]|uniref:Uncharacterized protein n=1 Tax=Hypothenemus hampei TaxID=57062 RepID=A0ABD1FC68_HYPHA